MWSAREQAPKEMEKTAKNPFLNDTNVWASLD